MQATTLFHSTAAQQALAADGAIACFSSSLLRCSLNADRAPQLKASVRLLSDDGSKMALAYLHGEGILFSTVIHAFFGLLGGALLLFGILKVRSAAGVAIALAYITITFVCVLLLQRFSYSQLGITGEVLTLPWTLILPCYNLDRSCPLSPGVAFICAELNAAALYFIVVLGSRLKDK